MISAIVKPSLLCCCGGGGGGGGGSSGGGCCWTVGDWALRSSAGRTVATVLLCKHIPGCVCVRRCVFRFDLWLKLRLHTGHLCGDSSKCRTLWTASVLDWQNPLPHSPHLNGFSFEWIYLKQDKEFLFNYFFYVCIYKFFRFTNYILFVFLI